MQIGETLYVTTRDDFRKWLIENHQKKKEIWMIRYKKAAKKPSIDYVEAVEEAICFGWIDNLEKGIEGNLIREVEKFVDEILRLEINSKLPDSLDTDVCEIMRAYSSEKWTAL